MQTKKPLFPLLHEQNYNPFLKFPSLTHFFELEPIAGKKVILDFSRHWVEGAVADYKAYGENVRIFHSFMYKADSWKYQQRVLVKIEINRQGTNVRYVVTDFKGQRSSFIYSDCYCDRGRMELMTNELKNGLGRTECPAISSRPISSVYFSIVPHTLLFMPSRMIC